MDSQQLLEQIHIKWWVGYRRHELIESICRHAFHLDLVIQQGARGITVCDLGGGWGGVGVGGWGWGEGSFSSAVAVSGMKSILIDDFKDSGFFQKDDAR